MSTTEHPLLKPILFLEIANLVTKHGIKFLVETGTGPRSSGMEAAARLGLHGYTCDVQPSCAHRAAEAYPEFDVYLGDSLSALRDFLPKIKGPTFFWLDGHCPTDNSCLPGGIYPLYEEMKLIQELKEGWQHDVIWMDDISMIADPQNPVAILDWDLDLHGMRWYGEKEHTWAQYLGVFADTHSQLLDENERILKITPK